MKEKLQTLAQKEKETAARHRTALTALHTGAVDLDTSTSVLTYARTGVRTPASPATPGSLGGRSKVRCAGGSNSKANINTSFGSVRSAASNGTNGSSGSAANKVEAWELIEALEHQKDTLEAQNRELTTQVADLSAALRQRENRRMQLHTHTQDHHGTDFDNDYDDTAADLSEQIQGGEWSFDLDESGGVWAAGSKGRQSRLLTPTAQVKVLQGTVEEQKRRIEQLESRCEAFAQSQQEGDALNAQLRKRIVELQDVRTYALTIINNT